MKRLRIIGDVLLKSIFILLMLSLCWISAYFVTDWSFQRWGWHSSMLLRQLSISILGFIFFGVFISIISPFVRKKQMAFFYELTHALKRISKGDFQINLNTFEGRNDSPLGQLAYSINDMAVNLKAMEEMRQEFISNVSHEIQSPLTSISGFARAMLYEELPREDQLQYLAIIEAESVRLSRLSDDLLRLSSLNSEHHPFHPEEYRLDKQLQLQILTFEPQWLDKNLEIRVSLAELSVKADKNLLSQVWVNLIHNAVKFTPEGGTISVTLEQQDDRAVVHIADSGIGMSAEDQSRIFERFFKADKSRTRTAGGSGLGLSIVHKIVELHQGTISVRSQLGEGTTLSISLPCHPH
ncbi:HAMP domain-containing sensor histidine kinase [Paenibacillus mendelii]|uniref:histidine kinase n=1 Tax=Paenibacillus mendelii TaxID=206163 RepID=A0ABV6JLZ9_9BACL|nr:HAMP domain-containing sensor histidine kinase [Paenibacillus mendelii]MCQ6560588.1 HAMP domain-containing histidine kinase [Paenibacillus mendelii]